MIRLGALGIVAAALLAPGCRRSSDDAAAPAPPPTWPTILVTTPAGVQHAAVTIAFQLADPESDPTDVAVEYSMDGGASYAPATPAANQTPLALLPTLPAGLPYTWTWNSMADGVATASADTDVRIRMTPSNTETGPSHATGDFTLDNRFVLETVVAGRPQAAVGAYNSIALSGGLARIAYTDTGAGDLMYAEWDGAAWSIETVDATGYTGFFPSLALAAGGDPRIAYYDTAGALRFASRTGGVWTIETVESGPGVGLQCSLALSASGAPRIAYAAGGDLRLAEGGVAWTVSTVDAAGDTGYHASLALNPAGDPQIAYYDATNGDLRHAQRLAGVWTLATVDAAGDVGRFASLVLEGSDPRVAYADSTSHDVKYAARTGVTWSSVTVDAMGDVGEFCALALDGGLPRISYRDETFDLIRLASWTGTVWSVTILDAAGILPGETSIAADGGTQVAYFDGIDEDLKHWDGAVTRVDGSPACYDDVAMADGPRIAFRGATPTSASALRFASWTGSAWLVETIDAGARVGAWPSITLDSSGYPHIAYEDTLTRDLKTAWWDGVTWRVETVDWLGDVGTETSIAIGAGNVPYIAYTAAGDVRVASRPGATWTVETLGAGGEASVWAGAEPVVAYRNGSVTLKTRSSGVWTSSTVGSGAKPSLVAGPRLAFETTAGLRHARTPEWTTEAVGLGIFPSLVRDAIGIEWLGAYDDSMGAIRLFWRSGDAAWKSRTVASAAEPVGPRPLAAALRANGSPMLAWSDGGSLRFAQ